MSKNKEIAIKKINFLFDLNIFHTIRLGIESLSFFENKDIAIIIMLRKYAGFDKKYKISNEDIDTLKEYLERFTELENQNDPTLNELNTNIQYLNNSRNFLVEQANEEDETNLEELVEQIQKSFINLQEIPINNFIDSFLYRHFPDISNADRQNIKESILTNSHYDTDNELAELITQRLGHTEDYVNSPLSILFHYTSSSSDYSDYAGTDYSDATDISKYTDSPPEDYNSDFLNSESNVALGVSRINTKLFPSDSDEEPDSLLTSESVSVGAVLTAGEQSSLNSLAAVDVAGFDISVVNPWDIV